jgi:hypothetical protein
MAKASRGAALDLMISLEVRVFFAVFNLVISELT